MKNIFLIIFFTFFVSCAQKSEESESKNDDEGDANKEVKSRDDPHHLS